MIALPTAALQGIATWHPLGGGAHLRSGWVSMLVFISVLSMVLFIIQRQATFEVLGCFQIGATHPSHWTSGVMSLQGDFSITQLSGDPK